MCSGTQFANEFGKKVLQIITSANRPTIFSWGQDMQTAKYEATLLLKNDA